MAEEKGFIRIKTIIEVLGKPKEHIEKSIRDYVVGIKENPNFIVITEYYSKAKEQDNMFSVFTELEMVVKSPGALFGFCFDYMPSSIDVIKPEIISISDKGLTDMLNDLQAKLHNIDMIAKRLNNENNFLKRNLNTSLSNVISVILAVKKSATKEELSKLGGIELEEIGKFLETLIKEGKIKKEDNLYMLV